MWSRIRRGNRHGDPRPTGRVRQGTVAVAILLATWLLPSTPARATCQADDPIILTALTTMCWDCLFPISLFSVSIDPGTDEASTTPARGPGLSFPTPNPYPPPALCSCACLFPGFCMPGIPLGYWEPRYLVEVVHDPFCFPSLGVDLAVPDADALGQGVQQTGHDGTGESQQNVHYAHVHFILFPAFRIFSLLLDALCMNAGIVQNALSIGYLSEVDPLWTADVLATLMFPETILFANPIAGAACIADTIAATFNRPLDPLFWCAGGWGHLYPPMGLQSGNQGAFLGAQPLLWTRVLAKLARTGLETWAAANGEQLCHDVPTFMLVKSQYKWQLLDPVAHRASQCCLSLGASPARWEWAKSIPVIGESHVWLLWRRQNCCML